MFRSVVNFSVLGSKDKQQLLVRFVCIMCFGGIHVICTILLILMPNRMAFRVGGALDSIQVQYFLLNLCFSMVTFDLQAQLCLCILITTTDSAMSVPNSIVLGFGVVWALLTAAVGATAVLKESKVLVWVFMVQNLPQLAFFCYLMYELVRKWYQDSTYTLEAAAVTGALISLVIKGVLLWGLIRLVHSFGQGLRERSEYTVTCHCVSFLGSSHSNITLGRRQNKRYIRGILTKLCRFLNIMNCYTSLCCLDHVPDSEKSTFFKLY
ncbi:uncharacterized protein LOC129099823 isoform X2 [Anoplopoma fimbria]|nr:uncharacterized protein LOC129099823 isoform X2 [Anoplopoma fimbria]XP_054465190.1 uncharacterized protein LOC129099823 isoform X2 [Anoplopoma fimbria]